MLLVRVVGTQSRGETRRSDARARAIREAEVYLADVVRHLAGQGIAAQQAVPCGDVIERTLHVAAQWAADLIVMTTHGLGSRAYGSIARAVLDHTPAPVLLVSARTGPRGPSTLATGPRVLVPLDGTAWSEAALPVARMVMEALSGEIVLLRGIPQTGTVPHDPSGARDETRAYLRGLVARVLPVNHPARCDVRPGPPASAILAALRDSRAGLAVMATHGAGPRGGPARAQAGSITGMVFKHSFVPLLLVRVPDTAGGTVACAVAGTSLSAIPARRAAIAQRRSSEAASAFGRTKR